MLMDQKTTYCYDGDSPRMVSTSMATALKVLAGWLQTDEWTLNCTQNARS